MKRLMLNGVVNRIALVGVELEGGWDAPIIGEEIVGDGSVAFEQPVRAQTLAQLVTETNPYGDPLLAPAAPAPYPKFRKGEIVSKPYSTADIEAWIRKCYPQHVNATCGLHVHVSFFHKLNYSRLMVPEFTPYIIGELRKWADAEALPPDHMLRCRLDPGHKQTLQHCRHEYLGDKQVLVPRKDYNSRGTDYSRYTFINYCDRQHHSIECRGLPMFGTAGQFVTAADVDQAVRAVMEVINATNRYLSKMRQRERPVRVTVPEKFTIHREFGTIVR